MLDWNVEGDVLFRYGGAGQAQDKPKNRAVSRYRYETDIATRNAESSRIPRRRISWALAFGQ